MTTGRIESPVGRIRPGDPRKVLGAAQSLPDGGGGAVSDDNAGEGEPGRMKWDRKVSAGSMESSFRRSTITAEASTAAPG